MTSQDAVSGAQWDCVVPGCDERASAPTIMCPAHWGRVSAELRARIEREDTDRVKGISGATLRWVCAAAEAIRIIKEA